MAIPKLATFRAAEIEAITGVSQAQQRNLRRHGYLTKPGEGKAVHELADAAMMLIIGRLENLGVPPSTSTLVAKFKSAANVVVGFALQGAGAMGNPAPLHVVDPPVRFLIAYGRDPSEMTFQKSVTAFYDATWGVDVSTAIVLDLKLLGELLCKRAGKPLVEAEID